MKITMDSAGRIVIPKSIRERSKLQAGSVMEISYRDGAIRLEPVSLEVHLVQEGGVLVARPAEEVTPLKSEQVNQTLDAIRDRPR